MWRALQDGAEKFDGTMGGRPDGISVFTGSSLGTLVDVSTGGRVNTVGGTLYYIQLSPYAGPPGDAYSFTWTAIDPFTGSGAQVAQGFDGRGPGQDPTRASQSLGPVSVDLSSGNVFVAIPGPSFSSPAGALGISVGWNSLPGQPAPVRPSAGSGGACASSSAVTCHPMRDYSTGARSAPGLGAGFSLNLSAGVVPVQLIDHSALALDPPLASSGESSDAALVAAQDFVEVVEGDGSSRDFTHKPGTDDWIPAGLSIDGASSGPNEMVTPADQTEGARVVKNASPGTGEPTWTLVDADGTTATFGPVGADGKSRVWSVQEQQKGSSAASSLARIEYTYTAGTSGTLFPTSMTEQPSGRTLSLVWNGLDATNCPAAILCITGPDGQTWQYIGDTSGGTAGNLVSVTDGTRAVLGLGWTSGEVTSVKSADDLDPTSASPGYNSAHKIAIGYASSPNIAKAVSLTDYHLTQQGSQADNTWAFDYSQQDGTTGLSFGCGQFATPSFTHANIAAHQARSGCRVYTTVTRNGGPAWHYLTGLAGSLMQTTDPQLHTTLSEYAGDGRLLWSEDGNGQPTDDTYDGKTGQLLTVQAPDPDGSGPLGRPTTSYRYDEEKVGTTSTAGTPISGLRAEWYANNTLSGIAKTTTLTHSSGGILDENWSTTGPTALGSPSTDWSARFSGTISLPSTGAYDFRLSVDDGATVLIDDRPVVSDWTSGSLRTVTGDPAWLDAGQHRIVVEYFQGSSSSELHLSWKKPGDTSYSLIPASQVAPGYGLQTSTVSPEGEVSFSHFADPEAGKPDYTETGGSLRLVSSYTYDALGRILTRVQPKGNSSRTIGSDGALGGSPNTLYETEYTYYSDSATAAPPLGCASGSAVNQAGQLETISRSGYADQTSVYDAAGRTIASTNGKGTICSTYDAEGRLVSQRVPGDSTISSCPSDSSATACFSYDPAGLVRTSQTADGEIDLDYSEDGKVIKSTQKDAGGGVFGQATIDYTDNGDPANTIIAAGPLSSATNYHYQSGYTEHHLSTQKIIDPNGGQQEEGDFSYDANYRLIQIQNLDVANGAFTFLDYDNDGNITNVYNRHGAGANCFTPCSVPSDGHPYADFAYTHDQDGRITSQTRTGDSLGTDTTTFTYDAASRLDTTTLPSGLIRTYHYDDDSNRTSIDETPSGGSLTTVATYSYSTSAQDQLSSISTSGSTAYGYDTDGNTTSYGTNTLTWNGHGWIATDAPTSTANVAYTYDPLGRLQERATTGPSADSEYIYAGTSDQPTMVTDGSGTITESYLAGPLGIQRVNSGAPLNSSGIPNAGTVNMPDALGNNAVTIDGSATRTATYTYDAFGTPNESVPTNTLTDRYLAKNNRPLDTLTGLILMGARAYDSVTGRFVSTDPIDGGSSNLYDYADQDPVNNEDPDGTALAINTAGVSTDAEGYDSSDSGSVTLEYPNSTPDLTTLVTPSNGGKITKLIYPTAAPSQTILSKKKPRGGPGKAPTGPRRPPSIPGRPNGGRGHPGDTRRPPPGHKGPWPPKKK